MRRIAATGSGLKSNRVQSILNLGKKRGEPTFEAFREIALREEERELEARDKQQRADMTG